jgi:cellulose biosynthesis protein BcsQ
VVLIEKIDDIIYTNTFKFIIFATGRSELIVKSICLFNHKGGVSKTTTTFNLGWMLASKGYKVVVADLDSQCNLTGLILGYMAVDEDCFDFFYKNRENLTMKPIVDQLISGSTVDAIMAAAMGKLYNTSNKNLFLLPGHLDVSDLDSQLSVSLKVAMGIPATKNIVGNFPDVLRRIAEKYSADYLLLDVSPNVGGLNEILLMSSNYFIVPTSPDYFCLQAVGSLTKNIIKWHNEIEIFKRLNNIDSANYPVANHPKFLGIIQQRYRPRNEKPASSFNAWIEKIRIAVNASLIPELKKIQCTIDERDIERVLREDGSELTPYDLAHISDFNSLIAISQASQKPVFELTRDDIRRFNDKIFGKALETMLQNVQSFRTEFSLLADRIIKLTD